MDEPLVSLHRYFVWSNRMKLHFDEQMKSLGDPRDSFEVEGRMFVEPYMSYWYSGLYAVIEGWQELKLSDPVIDHLLKSPNVGLLRRYRNGTFHFQKTYYDDRFVNFIEEGTEVIEWVRVLHHALGRYLLKAMRGVVNEGVN